MPTAADLSLPTIKQERSLRSSVTDALRLAIVTGELVEGELYSAPTLAEPLGVSATPVREAMMDLAREGMVTTVKNKGFRVNRTPRAELAQLTQVRQLLEGPAMRAVAGVVPSEEITRLRGVADAILQAAREGDLKTYLSLDRELHAALLSHTRNNYLVRLATDLRGRTKLKALRMLADNGELDGSAQEHHELLDYIEQGDGDAAQALIVRHIGHSSGLWSTGADEPDVEPGPDWPRNLANDPRGKPA